MEKELEELSLILRKKLPHSRFPFVKIFGKRYSCDAHPELRMNFGNVKYHIKKTHKLNFETGEPLAKKEIFSSDSSSQKNFVNQNEARFRPEKHSLKDLIEIVDALFKMENKEAAMFIALNRFDEQMGIALYGFLQKKSVEEAGDRLIELVQPMPKD